MFNACSNEVHIIKHESNHVRALWGTCDHEERQTSYQICTTVDNKMYFLYEKQIWERHDAGKLQKVN